MVEKAIGTILYTVYSGGRGSDGYILSTVFTNLRILPIPLLGNAAQVAIDLEKTKHDFSPLAVYLWNELKKIPDDQQISYDTFEITDALFKYNKKLEVANGYIEEKMSALWSQAYFNIDRVVIEKLPDFEDPAIYLYKDKKTMFGVKSSLNRDPFTIKASMVDKIKDLIRRTPLASKLID